MARLLQRFIEPPRACGYLASEQAQLEVRLMVDVSTDELEALLQHGWRRFGPIYFRPVCAGCGECISLRVPVASYRVSRNQRRARNKAARLRRVVSIPRVDPARLALHARWHGEREARRGWEHSTLDDERYRIDFAFPHPAAREAAFYDDEAGGKLVGVGLFDQMPRSLSAVYFFHDPDYESESLGTANVVALMDDARHDGREYVYLGYRVDGCASLRYKARFVPHELLSGRPAPDETPLWVPATIE